MRQSDIPLLERLFYSDVEGEFRFKPQHYITSDNTQATTPVAVLLASWALGVAPVNFKTLGNVSFIVIGVVIASFGEIKFVLIGFLYQVGGIIFEAIRLTMVQRLLSSSEFKMDPLVSLYYFAPACALMNFVAALFFELPYITLEDLYQVGLLVLFANALIAFLLNVSVVFLVCSLPGISTDTITILTRLSTDRQDLLPRSHPLRRTQGRPPRRRLHGHLPRPSLRPPSLRLRHRPIRSSLLQARCRQAEGIPWWWWPRMGRLRP